MYSIYKPLKHLLGTQGCTDKDKLIDSQYATLSNLKNLSLCQDKYTQVQPLPGQVYPGIASARTSIPRYSLCQDKYTQV